MNVSVEELEQMIDDLDELRSMYLALRDEHAAGRAALQRIAQQQPQTLAWLRSNGVVFKGPLGTDPSNWAHVAFGIYTDLCEVDAIARAALTTKEEANAQAGTTA